MLKLQKPLGEIVNGALVGKVAAATKAAVQNNESDKPKTEKVFIISPDEEPKSKDENPISERKSRAGSSRKALTSVLTARSKVI